MCAQACRKTRKNASQHSNWLLQATVEVLQISVFRQYNASCGRLI
jgi:hypothetical protein